MPKPIARMATAAPAPDYYKCNRCGALIKPGFASGSVKDGLLCIECDKTVLASIGGAPKGFIKCAKCPTFLLEKDAAVTEGDNYTSLFMCEPCYRAIPIAQRKCAVCEELGAPLSFRDTHKPTEPPVFYCEECYVTQFKEERDRRKTPIRILTTLEPGSMPLVRAEFRIKTGYGGRQTQGQLTKKMRLHQLEKLKEDVNFAIDKVVTHMKKDAEAQAAV